MNEGNGTTCTAPLPVFEISYDGSRFFGSQLQPGVVTVQGVCEEALAPFCEGKARIQAAGRTDRGVHALGQVFALPGGLKPPPQATARMLDGKLAPAVRVRAWGLARPEFHPRFSASKRVYRYILRPGGCPSPFLDPYSLAVSEDLDWEAMEKAATLMEGEHNFIAFARNPSQQSRLERSIDSVTFLRTGAECAIEFRALSFLRGMVRNLMGALLAVGEGHLSPRGVADLLVARTKPVVPQPAPPVGLYLVRVEYPDDCFVEPLRPLEPRKKP